MLEELLRSTTPEEAEARLLDDGWNHVGTSNWCEVYADPQERVAVRLSAFDPTQTLFARFCQEKAGNRWLPKVHAIVEQAGGGEAIVMERLWPAMQDDAAALVAALAPSPAGASTPSSGGSAISRSEPDILALRTALRGLFAQGQERFPVWGGADIREGKILTDGAGNPKLSDPAFLQGPVLIRAIEAGDDAILGRFTQEELLRFLRIPYFRKDFDRQLLRRRLEQRVQELDLPSQ